MKRIEHKVFSFTVLEEQAGVLESWLFTLDKLGITNRLVQITTLPSKNTTYRVQDEYYDVMVPWVRMNVVYMELLD